MKTSKLYTYRRALRAALAGVTCGSIALAALMAPSPAIAAPEGKTKQVHFTLSHGGLFPLRIVSGDGEKWTGLAPDSELVMGGQVLIHMKTGKIRRWGVYWNHCVGHNCFKKVGNPLLDSGSGGGNKSINDTVGFSIPATRIPPLDVARLVNECNALLSQDKDNIYKTHEIIVSRPFTLGFDTYRGRKDKFEQAVPPPGSPPTPLKDVDHNKTINVGLQVVCEPVTRSSDVKAPPKVLEANLGLTTSGNTCPKPAKARVIIATEAPRTVYYKIRRGPIYTTTDWIKGETKEVPNLLGTGTSAVLDATHELGKLDPGYTTYRLVIQGSGTTPDKGINVDCPPFEVLSAWLKYDVEDKATCPKKVVETATFYTNRPGMVPYEIKHQGGLVVHSGQVQAKRQGDKYVATAIRNLTMKETFNADMMADVKNSPANSGWVPLKIDCLEAMSGKLTLQSLGATSCKGEALVAIHTNGAGELPYELECGPGKSWQRKVTAMANKIGVDKVQFAVSNNELVTCVLRTRIGGVLKPLDGGSKTFQCHKPIDTGASVDLVPQTRPDPQKPTKPRIVVVDAKPGKPVVSDPKIGCANGKVKDGACTCETNFKPVKAGKNAWRCVADAKPETPKIACAGGKVSKGECVCGKGMKPVKAGDHAFRCVKSEAPTTSANGKADSKKTYGKKAESKAVQSNTNSLKRRTR